MAGLKPETSAYAEANATIASPVGSGARTPLEEVLAGIWANLLEVDRVGVNENFFALGGHSLLAMRLIQETNSAFGVTLPLRALFAAPTVAGQARQIERLQGVKDDEQSVRSTLGRSGQKAASRRSFSSPEASVARRNLSFTPA